MSYFVSILSFLFVSSITLFLNYVKDFFVDMHSMNFLQKIMDSYYLAQYFIKVFI